MANLFSPLTNRLNQKNSLVKNRVDSNNRVYTLINSPEAGKKILSPDVDLQALSPESERFLNWLSSFSSILPVTHPGRSSRAIKSAAQLRLRVTYVNQKFAWSTGKLVCRCLSKNLVRFHRMRFSVQEDVDPCKSATARAAAAITNDHYRRVSTLPSPLPSHHARIYNPRVAVDRVLLRVISDDVVVETTSPAACLDRRIKVALAIADNYSDRRRAADRTRLGGSFYRRIIGQVIDVAADFFPQALLAGEAPRTLGERCAWFQSENLEACARVVILRWGNQDAGPPSQFVQGRGTGARSITGGGERRGRLQVGQVVARQSMLGSSERLELQREISRGYQVERASVKGEEETCDWTSQLFWRKHGGSPGRDNRGSV